MNHILRRTLGAAALAVTLALTACAPATLSSTNRARDYVAKPGRLYVIYLTNLAWGQDFVTAFRDKFREIALQCGTTVEFESYTGLELEERGMLDRAVTFGADTILSISHGGGVVMMPEGRRVSVQYATTLRDMHESRTVWRGKFDFGRGGTVIPIEERAQIFAIELTNSLKQDQMLRGCTQIAIGSNNRLAQAPGAPLAPKAILQSPAMAAATPSTPAPAAPATATPPAKLAASAIPPATPSAIPSASSTKSAGNATKRGTDPVPPGTPGAVKMSELDALLVPEPITRKMPPGATLPNSQVKARMGELESLLPTQ